MMQLIVIILSDVTLFNSSAGKDVPLKLWLQALLGLEASPPEIFMLYFSQNGCQLSI